MKALPPTRIWLAVSVVVAIHTHTAFSQHLTSARAIGMGAYTALTLDVSSLDWNPAGLINIKDVEVEATSFYTPKGGDRSLTLQATGGGKRFMTDHTAALRISPGTSLEFVVPSTILVRDATNSIATTFDKKIDYNERYALGYAFRLHNTVSLGLSAHYLEEKVTDTRFTVDSNFVVRSYAVEYTGNAWAMDWGVLWVPEAPWRIGVVAKNLFRITETQIAEEARQYSLSTPKLLRFGVGYTGLKNFVLGMDGDAERQLRLGGEATLAYNLEFRTGLYVDGSSPMRADAISFGLGGSYQLLRVDLSYLVFFSQANRRGTADINAFQHSNIGNIEYNAFTSDRISLTARINLGRTRESLARIEYVEMLSDVFPASQPVYAFRPIGRARVRNISTKPIDAKISFYVDRLMDAPTQTKPSTIGPGDALEIPFYAVFNDALRSISSLLIREGDVYVNASPAEDYDDRYQTKLLLHGRNDWDGDVTLLKYFVTPDDPDVLKFSRSALNQHKARLETLPEPLNNLERAKIIFDQLAQHLLYVNDPKKSQDFVQYPAETLDLHGGDCDDMTVCYSALLASVGISVAFIDVVPPDHPDASHIYMMFDTGIGARNAQLLSDNPKRYIIRKDVNGVESVWIPVETTVLARGFNEAWSAGAREYFNDVEVNLGLVKGWVRVIDLDTIY